MNENEEFIAKVEKRLEQGAKEYGATSFDKMLCELFDEIEEEVLDIAGWALIMKAAYYGEDSIQASLIYTACNDFDADLTSQDLLKLSNCVGKEPFLLMIRSLLAMSRENYKVIKQSRRLQGYNGEEDTK